jgi:hypothetical protein
MYVANPTTYLLPMKFLGGGIVIRNDHGALADRCASWLEAFPIDCKKVSGVGTSYIASV